MLFPQQRMLGVSIAFPRAWCSKWRLLHGQNKISGRLILQILAESGGFWRILADFGGSCGFWRMLQNFAKYRCPFKFIKKPIFWFLADPIWGSMSFSLKIFLRFSLRFLLRFYTDFQKIFRKTQKTQKTRKQCFFPNSECLGFQLLSPGLASHGGASSTAKSRFLAG